MTHPSIDQGLLSPSGRVSKRAATGAHRRMVAELFPPGFWDKLRQEEPWSARLLRQAAELRGLAERGMKPRAYRKEAERLEQEARALVALAPTPDIGGQERGHNGVTRAKATRVA